MKPMRAVLACLVLSTSAVAASAQAPPEAAELARRLQDRYDRVQTFTADFTQTYAGGLLGLTTTESGRLTLSKPGRFRMEYLQPEQKVFVADGVMFYGYFPEDQVGSQEPLPKDDEASTALLFIAGRGQLVRDFIPRLAARQPEGEWHLELTPRTPQPEFVTLTLIVDRSSLALRGFSWTDDQGGTTSTRFTELRENVPVPDRTFAFRFPPGVIVR